MLFLKSSYRTMRSVSFGKGLNISILVKNKYWLPMWCSKKKLWGHFKSRCRCKRLAIMCSQYMMHVLFWLQFRKRRQSFYHKKSKECVSVCVYLGSSKESECIRFLCSFCSYICSVFRFCFFKFVWWSCIYGKMYYGLVIALFGP